LEEKTYDVNDTEANHSNAGTVRPNVIASVRRANLTKGKRKASNFSPGER
jgi:hypothetical protein